ncbi:septation ring formation regulator EzrA [Neobacillus sp. D3-1R]|uniref:septation ring formation regulator EzrA n=1 Tax=Neobacillus sp. D3-1R TaxID=3445778 RepID=UPI003FA0EFD6
MEYILGIIIIIIGLILVGIFSKKKFYKEIDRLEQWKIEMMGRPILEEMSKVKQLNMTGQTEELFERWRTEWDEVVTIDLPDVEEYLFDAEEYIDKYRFKRAREVQNKIDQKLLKTEGKINKILSELNELVGSEEKNRMEIEQLKDEYREAKKNLLAHRHQFGKAELRLELLLDEVIVQFGTYEEKTENGNYLEAREIVLVIKDQLDQIKNKMEWIPAFLVDCQSALPAQISELREGFREMLEQGYVLEHIPVLKETEHLENELELLKAQVESADIHDVHTKIKEIKENIDLLYDLLEQEVHAKAFIVKSNEPTGQLLDITHQESDELKTETQLVQQTYHLTEHELEQSRQMETRLAEITKKFEILKFKIEQNDIAHSLLSEELTVIKDEIETIQTEQKTYKEKLQMLRKDEMVAREKVAELKRKLNEAIRLVTKSNIPGLPEEYKYLVEDAKEGIQNVMIRLEQKPLDMQSVHQYLEVAVMTIEKLIRTTEDMIENVHLAEKVIQYGNRYKSRFPSVANGLRNAEQEFRSFHYQEALEQAATAIEEVEPGALKKIEAMLTDKE